MQYYLYISNEATRPFEEEELLRSLREGEIEPETLVQIVGGDGEWFTAARLQEGEAEPFGPTPAPSVPPPARIEKAPAAELIEGDLTPVLRTIRARTCYSVLRVFIDFFFFVKIAAALAGAGFLVWQGTQEQSSRAIFYYFGAAGGFFIVVVLGIAVRQWLTLFVDVADTLIAQHARQLRR